MELIRGGYNLRPRHRGCVITIGNFDGVHLGHQALLERLKAQGEAHQLPTCVVTFEPHPIEYFGKNVKPRLTKLRGKVLALQNEGIDRVLVLRFDAALAAMGAEDFVRTLLVEALGAQYVLVGDDFRFGHAREGDFNLLARLGQDLGFEAEHMPTLAIEQERVSSTLVRNALEAGDMQRAHQLLGHPYTMSGRIAHGHQRGRIIGFPTANIFLHRKAVPLHGVYCVTMTGLEEGEVNGVANVGTRPTVGGTRALLEVHLFDFDREIYGEHVHVAFAKKLRDEQKYDSFELLKQQIMIDADQARAYFAALSSTV